MNTDKEQENLEFINSCQEPEDLLELPLTHPQARALFQYRRENGNLGSLDELLGVRGIGKRTLEKIKDWSVPAKMDGPGTTPSSQQSHLEIKREFLGLLKNWLDYVRQTVVKSKFRLVSLAEDVDFTRKKAVWVAVIGYIVLEFPLFYLARISYGWFIVCAAAGSILGVRVLLAALGNLLSGQKRAAIAESVIFLSIVVFLGGAFGYLSYPDVQKNEPSALLQNPAALNYQILDEETSDTPIKTQVVLKLLVSGEITQDGLRKLLGDSYREIVARTGFQYHESPTNVYVYAYTSEERAESGDLWIAMLNKNHSDSNPTISVNQRQLAFLDQESEIRFGLTEEQRAAVFKKMVHAEDQSAARAMAKYPDPTPGSPGYSQEAFRQQLARQAEEMDRLNEGYKQELAAEYGLTHEQLGQIVTEGLAKDWPFPPLP